MIKQISHRELEVLNLLTLGLTNAEIAGNLYISQETVKSHRSNLLHKIEAKNVAHLVRKAFEFELIQIRPTRI